MFLLKVIFAILICCPFIYLARYLFASLYKSANRKKN